MNMGLDMYIYRIRKFEDATLRDVFAVDAWLDLQRYKKEHPGYKCTMKKWCGMEKPAKKIIDFYRNCSPIYEEIAYWRKENAIHKWFVKNVQDGEDDCGVHRPLTKDDIKNLRRLCIDVMESPEDAQKILPTEGGFFFGNTVYNEWYFNGVKDTIGQLNYILGNVDFDTEAIFYVSSW